MTTQKIAAIYTRVSTDEQAETNNSLPSQVRRCLEYARLHDFTVPDEFIYREDFTGTKFNRPEVDKLMQSAKRGEFDAVIVLSSDRLTREPTHGEQFRTLLRRYGVELHYTTRGKIEHTPEAEMFSGIEGQFDRYWRHKILEGMTRGRWEKAQSGKWVGNGRPPYGYDKRGEKGNAELIINEQRAEVVRRIFAWFIDERLSRAEIARRLTLEGVPTPGDVNAPHLKRRGYGEWAPCTVYEILKSEVYYGVSVARRKYYEEDETGKPRAKYRDQSEWITSPIPAIVKQERWEEAQRLIGGNKGGKPRDTSAERLLSRLLTCKCGYKITSSKRKGERGLRWYHYYNCSSYSGAGGNCGLPSFPIEMVDKAAWAAIADLLLNPERLIIAQRQQQEEADRKNQGVQERIDVLNEGIARHEKRLEKLLRLIANTDDPHEEAVWTQEKNAVKEALRGAVAERDLLSQQVQADAVPAEVIRSLAELGREYGDILTSPDLDMAFKRGIVEDLRITGMLTVEGGEKVLYLRYCGKEDRVLVAAAPCVSSELNRRVTAQLQQHTIVIRIPLRKAA